MTKNNDTGLIRGPVIGMSTLLIPLTRNNWRASLVPAAAVIPAPTIAYIKVVAELKSSYLLDLQAGQGVVHYLMLLPLVRHTDGGLLGTSLPSVQSPLSTLLWKILELVKISRNDEVHTPEGGVAEE